MGDLSRASLLRRPEFCEVRIAVSWELLYLLKWDRLGRCPETQKYN